MTVNFLFPIVRLGSDCWSDLIFSEGLLRNLIFAEFKLHYFIDFLMYGTSFRLKIGRISPFECFQNVMYQWLLYLSPYHRKIVENIVEKTEI